MYIIYNTYVIYIYIYRYIYYIYYIIYIYTYIYYIYTYIIYIINIYIYNFTKFTGKHLRRRNLLLDKVSAWSAVLLQNRYS